MHYLSKETYNLKYLLVARSYGTYNCFRGTIATTTVINWNIVNKVKIKDT